MTLAVPVITGSIKVVAVGSAGLIARGRPAEFRHRGLSLATRPTAIAALLEVGRDPSSLVLVPTDLPDMPPIEFIDVLRSVAHVPVIAGIVPGCSSSLVSELIDHGVASTVDLPATPTRLADAVLSSRPAESPRALVLEVGDLILDEGRHHVSWHGRDVVLPPKNFEILRYLILAQHRVVPLRELMEFVGEASADRATRARVAIRRLRVAFAEAVPEHCPPVETVHGVGYRLRA